MTVAFTCALHWSGDITGSSAHLLPVSSLSGGHRSGRTSQGDAVIGSPPPLQITLL